MKLSPGVKLRRDRYVGDPAFANTPILPEQADVGSVASVYVAAAEFVNVTDAFWPGAVVVTVALPPPIVAVAVTSAGTL